MDSASQSKKYCPKEVIDTQEVTLPHTAAVVIPSSEPSMSASAANFKYDGAVFFPSN